MKRFLLFLMFVPLVFGASVDEASDALVNASLDIEHLKSLNFSTVSFEDKLFQMNEAFEGKNLSALLERARILNESGEESKSILAAELYVLINQSIESGLRPGINYSFVVEGAYWIRERKALAFESRDLLVDFESRIDTINISKGFLFPVYDTLEQARKAFADERYDDALSLISRGDDELEQAVVESARERAFLRLARRNIVNYVEDHWRGLLFSLFVVVILCLYGFVEIRSYRASVRLRKLSAELFAVSQSMRSTQDDYYNGRIGAGSYKTRMDSFKKRARELKTELSVVRSLSRSYDKFSLLARFKRS